MSQDRLSGLALLNIHQELDIPVKVIIDCFVNSKNRNLDILYIFKIYLIFLIYNDNLTIWSNYLFIFFFMKEYIVWDLILLINSN